MKKATASAKVILLSAGCLLFIFVSFIAQTPQPSPSSTPEASPSVSPTPSPSRVPTPSPTPLPGAQNFHQWGSVTVFNGLPSDSVRAIAQTDDGVMWFGTDNGLARFDGRRVQNFLPGEPDSNGVLTLKVFHSGELWVGTRSGAFVYAGNRFRSVRGTENYAITTILGVDEGVNLGTDAGLVLRCRTDETNQYSAEPLFSDPIKTNDGAVVSITGLTMYDGRVQASTSGRGVLTLTDRATESAITSRTPLVHAMVKDSSNRIWLGTEATKGVSGVYVSDGGAPTRVAAPTADVFSLEANDSGIWAGTERYGLFHLVDGKLKKNYTFENTSGGLRSNNIFAIFTDREGVIWLGTNRGVSRFDRLGASQETVSDIPNSNFVRTLYASSGRLLAGTNRGLFRHEKETWRPVPGFDNKVIYAIASQRSGQLLIGSANGLFDGTGRQILPGDVRGFAEFQSNTYAAISGRGVVKVAPDNGAQQVVSNDQSTTSIHTAADKLWIGTAGRGLFSYDGRATKLEVGPEVLKSGTIWKISSGPSAELWIAGQHGVFRISNGQPETIVQTEDVRDVLVDGETVWAATTTRGLLHIRHDERFGWVVSAIGFEQGLPSEKAFSIIPIDEGILIATNRGVVTYKPRSIPPKIIATRLLSQRAHDLSELASTIALEYPQKSLLVEVAGQSSRTFPEEFQYAFVLTNAKGEVLDRRVSNDAQYAPADLAPGEYTIESIAFNRDLLPSEPLSIRFNVAKAPFPWIATALAVLLLLALLGLIWAIIEHRRTTLRNRELAAARFDLANEAERERRRIARDLHDQTLADLRNLMIKSDKMVGVNTEFRNEIEAVSTEIRRICEDLSPSVLENVGFVASLEFLLDHTVAKRRFNADEGVEERLDFPLNVQLQIYRIAQEVLTNIVRHSDADMIEMDVQASDTGAFAMTIKDNGKGFEPDGSQKGRGISNIRARANLINAKVAWKQSRDGGNTFSLHARSTNGNR